MADRFASLSVEESSEIDEFRDSNNTKKSTKQWINVLTDYLAEKGLDNLENIGDDRLDAILETFYKEVRMNPTSASGKSKANTNKPLMYANSSLKVMRAGINRYIQDIRGIDIVADPRFVKSNKSFKSVLSKGKAEGRGCVKHYGPIPDVDLEKMNAFLNDPANQCPRILQRKVLFDIMYFLCRRGRENLRDMTKDTFKVCFHF